VGSFGLLSHEKQIETVARAVARCAAHLPRLRLLLVGGVPEPGSLSRLLESLGVAGRTILAGRVPWDELPLYMTLPDMVVQLRYPSAGETSGALLRLLAQGRPAIVSDIPNQADLPESAVTRADLVDEEGDVTRAILRLAASPSLRARMSLAARSFVAEFHSPEHTVAGYWEAIQRAIALPDPEPRSWPAHWSTT
jgi:glycosyltransferase involved in cell wall biosynthesis